eukprot:SAG31_NODE_40751_length_279_cov_0.755556_1_plen_35_part_01
MLHRPLVVSTAALVVQIRTVLQLMDMIIALTTLFA